MHAAGTEPLAGTVTLAGQLATRTLTKLNVEVEVRVKVVLVAETVTAKLPAVGELHDKDAVPGTVEDTELIGWHVRPAGTVLDSVTVPVPLFAAMTLIVEDAESPIFAAGGETATTLKSRRVPNVTAKVAVFVTENPEIVAVALIVTPNVPAAAEVHENAMAAGTGLVAGKAEQVGPAGTVSERLTVAPVNPLTLVRTTFVAAVPLTAATMLAALILKSGLATVFLMTTPPAKPFTLATVADPLPLFVTGTLTAPAGPVTEKSPTKTVIEARWKTVGGTAVSVTFAVTT